MRIDVSVFRNDSECPEDYFISPSGRTCDICITYDGFKTIEGKLNDPSAMLHAISKTITESDNLSESEKNYLEFLRVNAGKVYDRVCGVYFYDNVLFQEAVSREPSLKNKEVFLYDSLIYFPDAEKNKNRNR